MEAGEHVTHRHGIEHGIEIANTLILGGEKSASKWGAGELKAGHSHGRSTRALEWDWICIPSDLVKAGELRELDAGLEYSMPAR